MSMFPVPCFLLGSCAFLPFTPRVGWGWLSKEMKAFSSLCDGHPVFSLAWRSSLARPCRELVPSKKPWCLFINWIACVFFVLILDLQSMAKTHKKLPGEHRALSRSLRVFTTLFWKKWRSIKSPWIIITLRDYIRSCFLSRMEQVLYMTSFPDTIFYQSMGMQESIITPCR